MAGLHVIIVKPENTCISMNNNSAKPHHRCIIYTVGWVERNFEKADAGFQRHIESNTSYILKNVVKPNFIPLASEKPQKRWVSLGLYLMWRIWRKFRFL